MWGDKTKYYLFSFLAGIIASKINFYITGYCHGGNSQLLCNAHTILLPTVLLLFTGLLTYNKQYDRLICSAGILIFCLGYNSHHYFNPNRIAIESEIIDHAKRYCLDMCNVIPSEYSCYIKALLFGDRTGITNAEKDLFVKTGTLHLFALSGLHAGIVYSMIYYVLYPLRLLRTKCIHPAICCLFLLLYSIISGASSSVMRATVMIAVYNIYKRALISSNKSDVLLITAFILSLFSPDSIFEVGFQLSFAAMTGLLYIYPYLKSCIMRLKPPLPVRYILNLSSVTLSCQIATFPLSIFYFGSISPIFILGNIVAVPLVTLIIYVSICALFLQRPIILFFCIKTVLTMLFDLLFYIINLLGK